LDEISFGQQYADTSYARYPNGTGDFVLMPPTFAAVNLLTVTEIVTNEDRTASVRLYPNPIKSYINIELDIAAPQAYELLSLMGKQVLKGVINSKNQTIDISFLAPNIYFLKIGNNTHKLIKTK
jgi:hypothetical protein